MDYEYKIQLTEFKTRSTWSKLCNPCIYLFTSDKRYFLLQKGVKYTESSILYIYVPFQSIVVNRGEFI